MARGRQQKWICKKCKTEFCVQNTVPKVCCSCGSPEIGRAPSYELLGNFEEKRCELQKICEELNPVYRKFARLKVRYDNVMTYWQQQKRRGYISADEYRTLARMYDGAKTPDENCP